MPELLRVDGVWAGYGGAIVLEGVSLALEAGSSLALLGRNGMGKTTLLATLMGATRLQRGSIHFSGRDITRLPSHLRARAGLGWVPQERDIFPSLSVQENLSVVARPGAWTLERVYALFPRLRERRGNMGDQLSGGEKQMLAMARALVLNPRLLLLDEPLEGLAPVIAQELLHVVDQLIHDGNMAVILVEQHARQILPITQNALVLDRGKVVYSGSSAALLADAQALDNWLGASGRTTTVRTSSAEAELRLAADGQAGSGPRAVQLIRVEHRAIAAVLNALLHITEDLAQDWDKADVALLASLIEYLAQVSNRLHHPKEDRIFALLRGKAPALDAHLDRLQAEHAGTERAISRLDRALVGYIQDVTPGGAQQLREAVRQYARYEWAHMGLEEKQVFPAALQHLDESDWAGVYQDFLANGDPWHGADNPYAQLYKRIVALLPAESTG